MAKKEELTGFRRISDSERKKIYHYLTASFGRTRNVMRIFYIILLFFGLSFFANVFININKVERSTTIIQLVISVLLIIASRCFENQAKKSTRVIESLKGADAQILDCVAESMEDNSNTLNSVFVKIRTGKQRCEDTFTLDQKSMEKWLKNPNYPLKLFRCRYELHGEQEYFELFSDEKLKDF